MVWAGATPYFDHRPSVDLLGKSDTVIAHEAPHHRPLLPGHMKWDYAYSIGELRLFPAIRAEPEDTIIAATGVSCRQQIAHGTGRPARHPLEVLRQALAGGRGVR